MPRITQAPSPGDVVKYQENPNYTNEAVTLLAGTAYAAGSVLGVVTASGKYTLATAAGSDGTKTAVAVLPNAVDATADDVTAVVLARGPAIVARAALVFGPSVDDATKTAAKHAELVAVGIVPRDNA